jgi:hypothetical protein
MAFMVVDGLNHPGARAILARCDFGLCDTCVHQRIVRNTRGSVFSLCRRSRDEPEFPRYPRVPVLECRGHEPRRRRMIRRRGGVAERG